MNLSAPRSAAFAAVGVVIFVSATASAGREAVEEVYLQKVLESGSNAIVVRRNGDAYLIEHGVGCLSLWRYEGRRVVIHSPGLFLGVGSTLLIPSQDQTCRVWKAELIGTGAAWLPSGTTGDTKYVNPFAAFAEGWRREMEKHQAERSTTPQTVASPRFAEPARIYVEGGPKELKNEVLALLRASLDLRPVPYIKDPEANIRVRKDGTAAVKCGDVKAVLPGPTASDLVEQFRAWVRVPLTKRRGPEGTPLP